MQSKCPPPRVYRPLRDSLFLASLALYAWSRFFLRDLRIGSVFEAYAGDLLLIPIFAPILVFCLQRAGLRRSTDPPDALEVILLLVAVAVTFEVVLPALPYFKDFSYADHFDVVMYALGACLASWWWSHWIRIHRDAETMPMRRPGRVFAASLLVAATVLLVSLVVSWRTYRADFRADDKQRMTEIVVQGYFNALGTLRDQGAALPATLGQMPPDEAKSLSAGDLSALGYFTWRQVEGYDVPSDHWGEPLVYSVEGDGFTVMSLGRDGKIGGKGYDADIVGGQPLGPAALASFGDFLVDQPAGGMIDTSILASILTFFASVNLLRRRRSVPRTLAAVGATVTGVTFVTVFLAGSHIPYYSGH